MSSMSSSLHAAHDDECQWEACRQQVAFTGGHLHIFQVDDLDSHLLASLAVHPAHQFS